MSGRRIELPRRAAIGEPQRKRGGVQVVVVKLHPTEAPRKSYVETCLAGRGGPTIAATDYIRMFADQIRPYVPGRYKVLGTDGFGRSDYRKKLRSFFEVDRHWVAVAALRALAEEGKVEPSVVADAIRKYGLDPNKPDPWRV